MPLPAVKKIVIGAALPDFSDKWLSYLQDGMKKYQATQKDVEVTYVDAQNDANKQLAQVENFISQKVNAIAIVPVDTVSIVDMVDRANKANIPIVVVNRSYDGVDKATSYVGSESITAGIMEMEEVAKLLNNKGNIGIMTGQSGQEAQIKRTEGNKQIISKNPEMKLVLEGTGSWDRAKGMALMENWLNSGQKNRCGCLQQRRNGDRRDYGGGSGRQSEGHRVRRRRCNPGCARVREIRQAACHRVPKCRRPSRGALETAIKAAKGEKVEKNVYIPYELVTKANVEEYIKKMAVIQYG